MNRRILILGDRRLVEEYSAACTAKGFEVVETGEADLALELSNLSREGKKANLQMLEGQFSPSTVILSSSVAVTRTEQATWISDPSRLVGMSAFPTLLGGSLIEFCDAQDLSHQARKAAEDFATALGKSAVFVRDAIGMVMPRILCMLVNEAYFAMGENVAEGREIDTAMKLGTNYPRGPVEWAQAAGLDQVVAILHALQSHYGEDRYRCAPMLSTAALRKHVKG